MLFREKVHRLTVYTLFEDTSYCYTAIDKELAQDETQGFGSPVSSWSDAERFEEIQKKYFGDSVLPGSGAEFIREAREARDAQLEGLG